MKLLIETTAIAATALALPRIIVFFRHHHYRFVSLLRAS
jgi:hypothetical protein